MVNWFYSKPIACGYNLTVLGKTKDNKVDLPPILINLRSQPGYSSVFALGKDRAVVFYVPEKYTLMHVEHCTSCVLFVHYLRDGK